MPPSKPTPPVATEPGVPPTRTETQVIASVKPENNVFFEQGSSDIDETGRATLRHHAERLKANPKTRVTLIGHAESFGSRAMSIAIADQRVSMVYAQLRRYGVLPRQLLRSNGGVENSKACPSPECRRLMRRVELRYAKGPLMGEVDRGARTMFAPVFMGARDLRRIIAVALATLCLRCHCLEPVVEESLVAGGVVVTFNRRQRRSDPCSRAGVGDRTGDDSKARGEASFGQAVETGQEQAAFENDAIADGTASTGSAGTQSEEW
ncbi:MAG: OmpA family protein [Sphingomonadales bacterium]|nr:OmpA family protein [Sphingomonadales bacterium]